MYDKYRGFILKTTVSGEADLHVVLFTAEVGLLNITAKGALKSKKRFSGGVLEPINFIECEIQKNRWLHEAQLLDGFEGIRTDYQRIELALLFLKYYHRLQINSEGQMMEHHQALFYLLGHALRALSNQENLLKIETQFLAKLLQDQGLLDISSNEQLFELVQKRFNSKLYLTETQLHEAQKHLRASLDDYLNLK